MPIIAQAKTDQEAVPKVMGARALTVRGTVEAIEVSRRAPARGAQPGAPVQVHPVRNEGPAASRAFILQKLTLGPGLRSDHGEMPKKVIVIVPRTAPALFAYLKEKFADDRTISVIMDRRIAERRRLSETPRTERRQGDRRQPRRDSAIMVSEP